MISEINFWHLQNHQLFKQLSSAQLEQLQVIVGFKQARKGEEIDFSSSSTSRIYFLKKGHLKLVTIDSDGNEVLNDIIQQGDIFGELGVKNLDQSHEVAIALSEEVLLCSFLQSDFEQLLLQYPNLALSYIKWVGWQLKRVQNKYANLVSKDAKSRLLTFLKDWAEREGKIEGNEVYLTNYLTQTDIAKLICTSRQTATLLLHELETAGLLQYHRKFITIFDRSKLY